MSEDAGGEGERTSARVSPVRWPGWVWAAPAGALLVVGFLVARMILHPSVGVEVLFDTAEGVLPGQTRVAYHGLDIGEVKSVGLAPDHRRILMKLSLKPDARPLLRAGTRFWIVGAKPSLTDINSLKSIFAGSSLEMAPGTGAPQRRFVGQDRPPAVTPGEAGRRFVLVADDLGSVQEGSSLYFHGLAAGKVLSRAVDGPERARAEVFVAAPYDVYVKARSRFWAYQPLHFSGGLQGVAAQLSAPGALLSGGVAFDTPAAIASEPQAARSQVFTLYANRSAADAAPLGPSAAYRVDFQGPVGQLPVGSPVRLRGFVVGRVAAVGLEIDPSTGRLRSPVTLALEPGRVPSAGTAAGLDAILARLVGQGLQARLVRDPPLVGEDEVRLEIAPPQAGARLPPVRRLDGRVVIPAGTDSDLDTLTSTATEVVAKVDRMPLVQIGQNLQAVSERLRTLTASPELTESLDHLHRALVNVDAMTTEARPQVGPLISSLRAAADQVQAAAASGQAVLGGTGAAQDSDLPSTLRQINEAARSLRALAGYLDRHPEALIRGKRPEKR